MRQVRLGYVLDEQFEQLARKHQASPSEMLRESVRQRLEAESMRATPAPALRAGGGEYKKVTLRVPAYVLEGARTRALLKGMKVSKWMVSLVQSNVSSDPVLTDPELLELEECARQLAAIGRNINQIARALHMAPHETDRIKVDQLKYLSDSIGRTKTAMLGLVRASRNAWASE